MNSTAIAGQVASLPFVDPSTRTIRLGLVTEAGARIDIAATMPSDTPDYLLDACKRTRPGQAIRFVGRWATADDGVCGQRRFEARSVNSLEVALASYAHAAGFSSAILDT